MQQQPETGTPGDAQQRVIAALTSLSRLALQTSTLRFSPQGSADHLAALLLDQIVELCEAQQGALFLASHEIPVAGHTHLLAPPLSLLARTRMSAEEAEQALARAEPVPDPLLWPIDLPSTLVWKRSLDPAPSLLGQADEALVPHVSADAAWLLFVWPETARQTRYEAQQQAAHLLPLLADLVDTILLQIQMALRKETPPTEIFPAEMLATVGHEFRGPLTTIQGYATTLLRHDQQLAPDERREFLHAISEASAHLGTLVNRFLELAQFETHESFFVPGAGQSVGADPGVDPRCPQKPISSTAAGSFSGTAGPRGSRHGRRDPPRRMDHRRRSAVA